MPFYEYECSACKYYVEALQKISDPPMVKCPSCGRESLQRLVSAPVFRLKGSGWYETDFKSDKETKRNIATDAEPAASDKKEGEEKKPAVRPRKKTPSAAAHKPAKKAAKKGPKTAPPKAAKKTAVKKAAKKVAKKAAKKVVKTGAKRAAKAPAKQAGKRRAAKKK